MDNRYIFPLYTEDEYELARDYLASCMYNNMIESECVNIEGEKLKSSLSEMITQMYGVNLVRMANYRMVQDIIVNKYIDSIFFYLRSCKVKSNIIQLDYQDIIPQIIAYKSQQPGFIPYKRFNPSEKWNFTYGDNIEKNLMNPLNGFPHYYIELVNLDNYDFMREIASSYHNYSNDLYDKANEWEAENIKVTLAFKVLPACNLHDINVLIMAMHKYF